MGKELPITNGLAQWRQLSRRQFCVKLHVILPQEVQWKPPLRQAAGTLAAIWATATCKLQIEYIENDWILIN